MFAVLSVSVLSALPPPSLGGGTITPAQDGTGTHVEYQSVEHQSVEHQFQGDDRYTITGGSQSSDGGNLFHTFDAFSVNTGATATFLSAPDTQNIFGRVVGGHGSVIDGTVGVVGSDANLFLLNPAGIIFGSNARLDVPGSFMATTANSGEFAGGVWSGTAWPETIANYGALLGHPQGVGFGRNPGNLVNLGQLAVEPGARLALVAGTVVNQGTVMAPGGQVAIAAVPGGQWLRISAPDQILALELARSPKSSHFSHFSNLSDVALEPLSLGELLTGLGPEAATEIQIDNTGQVVLGNPDPPAGTAIASGTLSADNPTGTGGVVVVVGDRVITQDGQISATGAGQGGDVYLGGTFQGGSAASEELGVQPQLFNAQTTTVDRTTTIDVSAVGTGDGGTAIVWADDATRFEGAIAARGGNVAGDGGFVEVSGLQQLGFNGTVDVGAVQGIPGQLLLDPQDVVIEDPNASGFLDGNSTLADQMLTVSEGGSSDFSITPAAVQMALATGDVTIQASRDIDVDGAIANPNDSNLTLEAGRDLTVTQAIASTGKSNLTLEAGRDITITANLTTNEGNITLHADTDSAGGGAVRVDNADIVVTQAGNISLQGIGRNNLQYRPGIQILNGSQLKTENGTISLIGAGDSAPTQAGVEGVLVRDSQLITTTGNITIQGEGGIGQRLNDGITLADTTVMAGTGSVTLMGTGGRGGDFNDGVELEDSTIEIAGGGAITITGTGGETNTEFGNRGVVVSDSRLEIKAGTGDIKITGQGGSASGMQPASSLVPDNHTGIVIARSNLIASPFGNIQVEGTGGNSQGEGSLGIFIFEEGEFLAPGGAIALTGRGGTSSGGNNIGIEIEGPAAGSLTTLKFEAGEVSFDGQGGLGTQTARGVRFQEEVTVQAMTGPLSIMGQRTLGGNTGTPAIDVQATVELMPTQDLTVQSPEGGIQFLGAIQAGGSITVTALSSITTQDLIAGENITLTSTASDINTNDLTAGQGITLNTANNINTNDLTVGQGITLTSNTGDVRVDNLTAAQDIILTSTISDVVGKNLTIADPGSGDIRITAKDTIVFDRLSSRQTAGPGGDVTLESGGLVVVDTIDARGSTIGGDITLKSATGNIRGAATLIGGGCDGATLCTNGAIAINHGGRNPFRIGDGSVNGTAGTLWSNGTVLPNGEVIPNEPGTFSQGAIDITPGGSVTSSPTSPSSPVSPPPPPRPVLLSPLLTPSSPETLPPPAEDDPTAPSTDSGTEMTGTVTPPLISTPDPTPPPTPDNSDGGGASTPGTPFPTPLTVPPDPTPTPSTDSPTLTDLTDVQDVPTEPINSNIPGLSPTETLDPDLTPANPTIAPSNPVAIGGGTLFPLSLLSLDQAIALNQDLQGDPEVSSQTTDLDLPLLSLGVTPTTLINEINQATSALDRALERGDIPGAIAAADELYNLQFADYFGTNPQDGQSGGGLRYALDNTKSDEELELERGEATEEVDAQMEALSSGQDFVTQAEILLRTWGDRTGKTFAMLYPLAFPDRLELLLITSRGESIRRTVADTNNTKLRYLIAQFRQELTNPFTRQDHSYRAISQRLYRYIIEPVAPILAAEDINSLLIAPGPQLRSVPYGALMNGDRFLMQDYGITLVPSFQAINSKITLKRGGQVLAMGSSHFAGLDPLPYARAEANAITQVFSSGGGTFTNEEFTEDNLLAQRRQYPYQTIHLATHASFRDGHVDNSYIQFWDSRLNLGNLERLNLGSPIVDLLILSACKTAVGNEAAELGFAGLTIKSGARTAIASQWDVDDEATMILMTYFYYFWNDPAITTKAEALQRAQLFLLENRLQINSNHELILPNGQAIALPVLTHGPHHFDADTGHTHTHTLTHPYFWAAFTTIGSPW